MIQCTSQTVENRWTYCKLLLILKQAETEIQYIKAFNMGFLPFEYLDEESSKFDCKSKLGIVPEPKVYQESWEQDSSEIQGFKGGYKMLLKKDSGSPIDKLRSLNPERTFR